MTFERHHDLDGCRVRVRGVGDDLARVIDLLLGPYAVEATAEPAAPHVDVVLERGPAPASPAGGEPPRFTFPPLAAWPAPGGWRLHDDVAAVEVRADARAATVHGVVAAPGVAMELLSRFAGLTLWIALIECLRARGRYPLHAAALVAPGGETVLVPGTKGAGKSTLTLALLERGWSVVSDDTLFVERGAGGLALLGYRKRFHVRLDLAARRPDLAPLLRAPAPFEPQDKRWLALAESPRFAGRVRERAAAPARILFPEIVDAPRSRREPMPARDALLGLLAASSFVFVRPELAPDHLAVLRELVDGATCARLRCGRDLLADADGYLALVATPPTTLEAAS
jgi:hypothetical protein